MPHPTLIITHRGQWHQEQLAAAAPSDLQVTVRRDVPKDEMLALLPEIEFLISEREDPIDADMIAAGRKLRLIQRLGSQTWDIDLQAAQKAGIPVCYWPDQGTINVAEHCLMLTLDLLKKSRDCQRVMNEAAWDRPPRRSDEDTFAYNWSGRHGSRSLREAVIGILGFGEIGRNLAARLQGFEAARVYYHKRKPMPPEAEKQLGITYAKPDTILREADVLYNLLPYSAQDDQSINAAFFAQMKPGAFFVSCGGSGLVDEAALAEALRSGHLDGAALDTYTWEPIPPQSPLLELHRDLSINLALTPHVAAGTSGGGGRSEHYTNIRRQLAGEDLLYRVSA